MTNEKPKAYFKAELIVSFNLPGVEWSCRSGNGAGQLEKKFDEGWTLRVNADNAEETSATLRQIADEIDRVRLAAR